MELTSSARLGYGALLVELLSQLRTVCARRIQFKRARNPGGNLTIIDEDVQCFNPISK